MAFQAKTIANLRQKETDDVTRVGEKLQEFGLDPAEYDIAILPAFDRHLEKTSERRKQIFADRLAEIAADFAVDANKSPTRPKKVENAALAPAFVARACATCQGYCCKNGGDRAYLTSQTVARVLANSPRMTLEDVVRAYLDRIPRESYARSCIYHGEKGCNLPFEMRSDTCNDFYCSDLRRWSPSKSQEASRPILAAALKGEKIVRLVVIDDEEMKPVFGK